MDLSGIDPIIGSLITTLISGAVVGYIRLAFGSVRKEMSTVADSVKATAARMEATLEKIEGRLDVHSERIHSIQVSQAKREGRDEAIKLVSEGGG